MIYGINILLLSIFIITNSFIIYHDLRYKTIPNKYLGILLGCAIIWMILLEINEIPNYSTNIGNSILQIVLSLFTVFLLYSFKVWGAGDSKYIFVLSLFLPSISILVLFFNTSFFILLYLIGYLIYFFMIKTLISRKFRKSLLKVMKNDFLQFKEKFTNIGPGYTSKINAVIFFILLYLSIRYFRPLANDYVYNLILKQVGKRYENILLLILIIIGVAIIYTTTYSINYVRKKIESNSEKPLILKSIILYSSVASFILMLIYAYIHNPQNTFKYLQLVSTLYLIIFIGVFVGKYATYLVFDFSERNLIPLSNLREGMIIDKRNIQHILNGRENLAEDMGYNLETKILSKDDIKGLKKTIKYINLCTLKNKKNEDIIDTIITLKTYSFGLYIYIGFIISIIYEDKILQFILGLVSYFL